MEIREIFAKVDGQIGVHPFGDTHVLEVHLKTGADLTEEKAKELVKGTKFSVLKFEKSKVE